MTADIIRFTHRAVRHHVIQRTGMILHIQPVANLLTVAIDRQWFTRQRIQNHQRDQFFREMVGPVVIRAVGDKRRQTGT